MQLVPLHCLLFDPQRMGKYLAHEMLSCERIMYDLVGDSQRQDLHRIIFSEMRHRVQLKLSLGERVVLTDKLTSDEQAQLAAIAHEQGASVLHDIVDPMPVLRDSSIERLRKSYRGITVIGDIHGDANQLRQALGWAKSRQHFAWLLGDIVDYGRDTLVCVETVYEAVMHGRAGLSIGNHERKIARWLDQKQPRLNTGNKVTVEALSRLSAYDRRRWVGRFRALLAHAALMTRFGNITLTHAAVHPSLWSSRPEQPGIEQFALYGQGETNGKYHRVRHWVDAVPKGQIVLVGHDVIAALPTILTGALGGQAVFLDTGCGKGGHLSTADLRFSENELRLECFNRFDG
jgi:protein phosphatase